MATSSLCGQPYVGSAPSTSAGSCPSCGTSTFRANVAEFQPLWSSLTRPARRSQKEWPTAILRTDLSPTTYWWCQVAGSGGARFRHSWRDNLQRREPWHREGGERSCHLRRHGRPLPGRKHGQSQYHAWTHLCGDFRSLKQEEKEDRVARRKCVVNDSLVTVTPSSTSDDEGASEHRWQSNVEEGDHVEGTDNSVADEAVPAADAHLPNFQVQSREEQERLAASPAHPKALLAMYASYLASCCVEKIWRFALPAILAILQDSLLPVAAVSFASQLTVFAGGPWVGEMMDRAPRVLAFNSLCLVQACAMLISAGVTGYAIKSGVTKGAAASTMFLQPWFLVLVVAGAVERLTGLASGVAIERDWVVQLAGHNRPIALANANATLRRVDLFCEIAGPLAFGWLLSKYSVVRCLNAASVMMVFTVPILMSLVKLTDFFSSGVLQRPKHLRAVEKNAPSKAEQQADSSATQEIQVPGGFSAALKGWQLYLAQPVLPASLAYVLLYFNAVLSPGGLMTSFLTQRGLDVSIIGVFRGACAAMGFLATFVSAPLIARMGVLKGGAVALAMQSVALVTSVLVYLFTPAGHTGALMLFLALVVISRLGHWTYDCIDAQIFQTAIPAGQANLVGTTEMALASLAELVMLAMAIVVHDVSHFGALAVVSMSSVLGATALYWRWLAKPTAHQKRLFPNEPHFVFEAESEIDGPLLESLAPASAS